MDKWEILKRWVGEKHDYFEAQYKKTNFSADAAELGAYRAVFMTMLDLERKAPEKKKQQNPTKSPRPA